MKSLLALFLAFSTTTFAAETFDKTVENQGISFHVQASGDTLTITPSGLTKDNSPIVTKIHGKVINAVAEDLNVDQSAEVYVFVQEPGPEKRLNLVAYSANNKKSLSLISMPELASIAGASKDYAGHDEFQLAEGYFIRVFPIGNGKYRQIQFKLGKGEATWQLKVDKVLVY